MKLSISLSWEEMALDVHNIMTYQRKYQTFMYADDVPFVDKTHITADELNHVMNQFVTANPKGRNFTILNLIRLA